MLEDLVRIAALIVLAATLGCAGPQSESSAPDDPIHSAVVDRLGSPDAVTGSGRSFLHYEIANGQTITVIISGDRVIGAKVGEAAP